MSEPLEELKRMMQEQRQFEEAVKDRANTMGAMLVGRLRYLSSWNLKRLKKELANYNIHTGGWK